MTQRWTNLLILIALIGVAVVAVLYPAKTIEVSKVPNDESLASSYSEREAILATVQPVISPLQHNKVPVNQLSDSLALPTSETTATGRLILLDHSLYPEHQLASFDLATATLTTLFAAPQDSWIYQFDLTRDGRQIVLAYAPPPNLGQLEGDMPGREPYDRSGLYLLSLDEPEAAPVPLLESDQANDYLFNPVWSADGQSIYYVSYRRTIAASNTAQGDRPDVALYRYDLASGDKVFIAQDGAWPRLSPDGERLVYIHVEPISQARSIQIIDTTQSGADTGRIEPGRVSGKSESEVVVTSNQFFDVDTPLFSPDGQRIYFSAVPHSTKVSSSVQPWWEILLGVKVAQAHSGQNIPADWWRVSINGGEPEQITSVRRIISFGEFDGSGQRLFFTTEMGVYTANMNNNMIDRLRLPNLYKFVIWTEWRGE